MYIFFQYVSTYLLDIRVINVSHLAVIVLEGAISAAVITEAAVLILIDVLYLLIDL